MLAVIKIVVGVIILAASLASTSEKGAGSSTPSDGSVPAPYASGIYPPGGGDGPPVSPKGTG